MDKHVIQIQNFYEFQQCLEMNYLLEAMPKSGRCLKQLVARLLIQRNATVASARRRWLCV